MNRREIIRRIALGGTSLMVYPVVFTSCEDEPDPDKNNDDPGDGTDGGTGGNSFTIDMDLPANAKLLNPGGFAVMNDAIVLNSDGTYLALSAKCTHEACTVSFNSSAGNLPCPCHGSVFSTSGAVVTGPAITPLSVYTVTRSGNILTIKK